MKFFQGLLHKRLPKAISIKINDKNLQTYGFSTELTKLEYIPPYQI